MIDASDGYRCPACESALVQVPSQLFRLECGSCHGVWLDGAGTEQVVKGAISVIDDEEEAMRRRDRALTPYRGAPRAFDGERSCPFCAGQLMTVTVPELGVDLDLCREHGTWFDMTELRAVVEHYLVKQTNEDQVLGMLIQRARDPTPRARRWHPFW